MRRASKVDRNQAEIVAALRGVGATVVPLHRVGAGVPDLLVGRFGTTFLIEVKDGAKPPSKRALTPDQEKFFADWRGGPLRTVKTVEEALKVVGAAR